MVRRDGVSHLVLAAVLYVSSVGPSLPIPQSGPGSGEPVQIRTQAIRPLAFEENVGQVDTQTRFVARTASFSLFFTESETVLATSHDAVRMKFIGSSPDTRLVPVEPLPGKTNYLIGTDPSQWKTGIRSYSKVRYEQLYPGVDLVFYGNDRELEYDLEVSPGADPHAVRLTLEGASDLAIADNGDLVGRSAYGELRFRKPVIYQKSGTGTPASVTGRYRLEGEQVAFEVDDYDPSQPLVIDPVVVYSTYLGGSASDTTAGSSGGGARQMIAVDAKGAAYVAGRTESPVFPTTSGSWQSSAPSYIGLGFITKIAPDGESVVYSTFVGGGTTTENCGGVHYCGGFPGGIAVDAAGSAYVTGDTWGSDFPAAPVFAGRNGRNLFLLKLDPSGSSLVYSVLYGSGYNDSASGVVVDSAGNAYVTGATNGFTFIQPDALQPTCYCPSGLGWTTDAFVVKFNPTATAVVYGTYLGGWGREVGSAIAVNASGEAYVTGRTSSDDFPIVNAAQPSHAGGGNDDFVLKLNASGSALVFSTFLGGSGNETGNALGSAIAVDVAGSAYVTGYTPSDFPTTPGSFQPDPPQGGAPRAYAVKYTSSGQRVYSTFLAGNGGSFGTSVAVDAQGRGYFGGSTSSTNFPIPVDATQPALAGGGNDAYVIVLDSAGSTMEFATYLGGAFGFEYATGVALGPGGSVYVAGITEGLGTFPTTANAFQPNYGGATDVFVTRIDLQPPDTTPPVITEISVNSNILWPPNHAMRSVTVTPTATDAVSAVTCAITNITSNEPVSGVGNGDQAPDWQGTAGLTTSLRAERDGRRSGRVYTLTVTCTDEAGNASTRSVGVVVPVNQGK